MTVNAENTKRWKSDIAQSVDFYNQWFMRFAPKAYRETRVETTKRVEEALHWTKNLTDIAPGVLKKYPSVLPILRMATAPPIARDRLIGLAQISGNLVRSMELDKRIPPTIRPDHLDGDLQKIGTVIKELADVDILTWLDAAKEPADDERYRAATIIADRLCGAVADPIIRNEQEKRQLAAIRKWLEGRGYTYIEPKGVEKPDAMQRGTFSFRLNVPIKQGGRVKQVNVPIDAVVMPKRAKTNQLPLLIEAKSAGDFTNVNKRRKEEATKVNQLRSTYGKGIQFILFLCGYFDSGYLGYEAAEEIDWVWEHRIEDFTKLGL